MWGTLLVNSLSISQGSDLDAAIVTNEPSMWEDVSFSWQAWFVVFRFGTLYLIFFKLYSGGKVNLLKFKFSCILQICKLFSGWKGTILDLRFKYSKSVTDSGSDFSQDDGAPELPVRVHGGAHPGGVAHVHQPLHLLLDEQEGQIRIHGRHGWGKERVMEVLLQTLSVTVTVLGNRKNVTVSDCHSIRWFSV